MLTPIPDPPTPIKPRQIPKFAITSICFGAGYITLLFFHLCLKLKQNQANQINQVNLRPLPLHLRPISPSHTSNRAKSTRACS